MSFAITDRSTRRAVWSRTGGACAYCGADIPFHSLGWEVEHARPRAQGGGNERENLLPACRDCNALKGDRTPEEFRQHLHSLILREFVALESLLRRFAPEDASQARYAVELFGERFRASGMVRFVREDLLGAAPYREDNARDDLTEAAG